MRFYSVPVECLMLMLIIVSCRQNPSSSTTSADMMPQSESSSSVGLESNTALGFSPFTTQQVNHSGPVNTVSYDYPLGGSEALRKAICEYMKLPLEVENLEAHFAKVDAEESEYLKNIIETDYPNVDGEPDYFESNVTEIKLWADMPMSVVYSIFNSYDCNKAAHSSHEYTSAAFLKEDGTLFGNEMVLVDEALESGDLYIAWMNEEAPILNDINTDRLREEYGPSLYSVWLTPWGLGFPISLCEAERCYRTESALWYIPYSVADKYLTEQGRAFTKGIPSATTYALEGMIDGKYPVSVDLTVEAFNKVHGTYFYTKQGEKAGRMQIYGKIVDGQLLLNEFTPDLFYTGRFTIDWSNPDKATGTYQREKEKKTMPCILSKR